MDEHTTALDNVQEWLKRMSGMCKFQKTASPDVFCSTLPSHWRSNKSLPCPFTVLVLYPVPDGTKVTISAGNEENACADIKNNVTEMTAQMARFSDLRFVGKSGRGKNFNLTITIHSQPLKEVAVVTGIIKVTVDGPRDSRNPNKTLIGDVRKRCAPGPLEAMAMGFSPLFAAAAHAIKQPRFSAPQSSPQTAISPQLLALAAAASGRFPPLAPTPAAAFPNPSAMALYESFLAAAALNPNVGFPSVQTNANGIADFLHTTGYSDGLKKRSGSNGELRNSLRGLQFDGSNSVPVSKLSAALLSPPAASMANGGATPKLPASVNLPSPRFDRVTSLRNTINKTTATKTPNAKIDSRATVVVTPSDSNRSDEIHVDVETTDDELQSAASLHHREVKVEKSTKEESDEHNRSTETEEPPRESSTTTRHPIIKLWRPYTPPTSTSPKGAKVEQQLTA
ncbi:hypothetical protein M3Y95_01065900 [Aphelenchoides besseyi]|nr:hypothetical protein M3Y95_01065900 [Aphelenchoides besseyi]